MAKQILFPGVEPTGFGGDTARVGTEKINSNFNELYAALGAPTSGASKDVIPSALPVNKGGTGATTVAAARLNLGLGDAATKTVGIASGNVVGVGGLGIGVNFRGHLATQVDMLSTPQEYISSSLSGKSGWYFITRELGEPIQLINAPTSYGYVFGVHSPSSNHSYAKRFITPLSGNNLYMQTAINSTTWSPLAFVRHSENTTVDGNGFLKNASPIIQLFTNKIELNDEAQQQDIEFEKLGMGDYLIKNTSGFAQEGWYIEQPKDANGNVLVAVIYEQLENNDISVKTYKKKFDLETASIVADLDKPTDIPEGRWIDIRLQELPQPEPEVESDFIASPDFQPTNLSEAVRSFMAGGGYVSE